MTSLRTQQLSQQARQLLEGDALTPDERKDLTAALRAADQLVAVDRERTDRVRELEAQARAARIEGGAELYRTAQQGALEQLAALEDLAHMQLAQELDDEREQLLAAGAVMVKAFTRAEGELSRLVGPVLERLKPAPAVRTSRVRAGVGFTR